MNYNDIIHHIEDEPIIPINNDYYHAFKYKQEEFIKMITEGIKSPILLGKNGDGNNGKFYVCLSKNEKCEKSIYDKLSSNPMFVINGSIHTIKSRNFTKYGHYPMCFMNSPLPFRECEYDDEYQKFWKVPPKYIIGIQYNIFSNCQQCNNVNYIKKQLLVLKKIVEDLNSQKNSLSIIDASTSNIINKEKVLSLKI